MRLFTFVSVVLAICLAAGASSAGIVGTMLGNSGWEVSTSSPSQNDVNIVWSEGTDISGRRYVALEISKIFHRYLNPLTGEVLPIILSFDQVKPDNLTATRIIIADETIANRTGITWRDYHWVLFRHDVASFNRDLSNITFNPNSPGWYISNFSSFSWDLNEDLGTDELSVFGGDVFDGNNFSAGPSAGNLVIDVDGLGNLSDAAHFVFKQFPTIPEPATLAMLALGGGGLAILRRRDRS